MQSAKLADNPDGASGVDSGVGVAVAVAVGVGATVGVGVGDGLAVAVGVGLELVTSGCGYVKGVYPGIAVSLKKCSPSLMT